MKIPFLNILLHFHLDIPINGSISIGRWWAWSKEYPGAPRRPKHERMIKHIEILLPDFFFCMIFLGLKLHCGIICPNKYVASYYFLFYKSFKFPSSMLQKYGFVFGYVIEILGLWMLISLSFLQTLIFMK